MPARYQSGFLRRSLSFAIPAGIVVTASLTIYALVARGFGIDQAEVRTGSTLLLTIIGLWILVVLSRPVTVAKALVIGAMMIGLILVYSIPLVANFLQLVDPGADTALLIVVVAALSIGAIEIVRAVHLRVTRRWAAQSTLEPGRSTAR